MVAHNLGNSRRVLVLGEDTRSFLGTIRSFGRAGFAVDVGWVDYRNPALASRYIQEVVPIPIYTPDSKAWLNELNRLVRERDYDFIVGCHDAQVLPLQYHRTELEHPERYALIPENAFSVSFNKQLTYELAYRLGIPVPAQRIAHSQADIAAAMSEWQCDLYIKPVRSTDIDNVAHQNAVIRVDHLTPIPAFDDETLAEGLLVQQTVLGKGVGVELLAKEGTILTAFQHERVHEPPIGGGSSYRRSVALNQGMLNAARKLMQALAYTGVAMVEFKYDANTDKWWLMEINGRFWGSLPLTIASGLNFPLYWYQMLRQGREEFPQQYQKNIYCRNWSADRYWFIRNLRVRRINKHLLTIPLISVIGEARHVILGRERSDTFVWDDPQPAIAELRQIITEPLDKRIRRLAFVRRRARAKAEKALSSARSLLFVCYGNICRSPFAEKAAQLGLSISINSAGTHPLSGRRSPAEAIQAALPQGIDLETHRSRVLDKTMIENADIIMVFDIQNEQNIIAQFPFAKSKIHQIACLDEGDYIVEDPFGKGIDAFDRCYKRIIQLVHRMSVLIGG